ncbi:MAG: hypothetical protein AVDCRST_MAG25-657 [uncultured Rubrobacteraceae bacterium]|uniref:DUF3891 family protein n=1 Tax=uncultured Rubrobacteraceae bacterium TaxID=349277 RepID=A0A6J4R418_9ACTN|nr:MAG: hypothetical protein AVDCRST_MAG25-657 [uncultured Rubrobacteraceae bacterium]
MIVREVGEGFLLIGQHDHGLAAGEMARRWARGPRPSPSALYAVAQHDLGWRGLDEDVLWNDETGRPHSFLDYPAEPKVRAFAAALDLLEERDPYAACLCSMHYATLMQGSRKEPEARFREAEERRQRSLKAGLTDEEAGALEHDLRLLKLCDGLSLFLCLNEPGREASNPAPYPDGFVLDGEEYVPAWVDERTLRVRPNPFDGPFRVGLPYRVVGRDRRPRPGGRLEIRMGG